VADLEAPGSDAELYRDRGNEVAKARPYFTGDVFEASEVRGLDGELLSTTVMIMQHPCAMRVNGVDLVPGLLVVEVAEHQYLKPSQWTGFTRVMPLPELLRDADHPAQTHHAAYFNRVHIVRPEGLGSRTASLSIRGVNLLLQRWVHHNSRVMVPSGEFLRVIGGVFEEADLIEEWCEERDALHLTAATAECINWLREQPADGTPMRQELLEDEQSRSSVRRQMRQHLQRLQQESQE
jgi:hypothetical protein